MGGEAWLRTTLSPSQFSQPATILEIPGQLFNYVDVWFRLPDGSILHDYSGVRYPYSERTVKHSNVAFEIPRIDDGPLDVLIRVRNDTAQPMNFAAWTWPDEAWTSYLLTVRMWYGVFLGAILALCIYNAFLAVTLRDVSYLYYLGYLICLTFAGVLLSGLAEEYLWPDSEAAPLILAMSGTGAFFSVSFVNRFLGIRKSEPWLYRGSTSLSVLAMVCGLALVVTQRLPFLPGEYSAAVVHVLTLLCSLYFIAIALLRYFRGYKPARFLALSMGSMLVSLLIYFSYTYGHVEYNPYVGHLVEVGTLLEGVLLSLALADRIKLLMEEKQRAERQAAEFHRDFSRKLIHAQEKERQLLSETMHDSIGHAMLVLKNNLEKCARVLAPGDSAPLLRTLERQAEYCGEIMHDIRRISHDLHPHILSRLGLPAAIESTMRRALDPLGIAWSASIDPLARELDADQQTVLYRAVQECLNNIMKYANASQVSCEIVCDGATIKTCVYDNGVGFDPLDAGKHSIGLEEMAGRVRVAGGHMNIESIPGEGTIIVFELPIKRAGERLEVVT
jgi:signal transduction histidine kinase